MKGHKLLRNHFVTDDSNGEFNGRIYEYVVAPGEDFVGMTL